MASKKAKKKGAGAPAPAIVAQKWAPAGSLYGRIQRALGTATPENPLVRPTLSPEVAFPLLRELQADRGLDAGLRQRLMYAVYRGTDFTLGDPGSRLAYKASAVAGAPEGTVLLEEVDLDVEGRVQPDSVSAPTASTATGRGTRSGPRVTELRWVTWVYVACGLLTLALWAPWVGRRMRPGLGGRPWSVATEVARRFVALTAVLVVSPIYIFWKTISSVRISRRSAPLDPRAPRSPE